MEHRLLPKFFRTVTWLSIVTLACTPLLFFPVTQDYYDVTKWYTLLPVSFMILMLWVLRYIRSTHSMHMTVSPAAAGLGSLTAVACASVVLSSPNKIEALLNPLGPLTFLALTVMAAFTPSLLDDPLKRAVRWAVFSVSSLLALISVYQFFGIGKIMLPMVTFLADPLWTPTGNTVSTLSILFITAPLLFAETYNAIQAKDEIPASILSIMSLLVTAGIGMTLWQFTGKISSILLPQSFGWAITLEILKNLKNALLGVGADNFLAAFSIGRPAAYNMTPLWAVRFITNSNFFFHITTVYGLLGLAASILFVKSLVAKNHSLSVRISLAIALGSLLITPPSVSVLIFLTVILLYTAQTRQHAIDIRPIHARGIAYTLIIILLCIGMAGTYGLFRSYRGEMLFFRSLKSAQANNGTETYNYQISAITANPAISRYHVIYSQTNLALATSLANSLSKPDSTLTDEQKTRDRELIAQLIQQSIREAKIAAKLNTTNILAWENMARIYQQLTDIAQGADTWSDASFKQAIMLDPVNPVLRLELGALAMKKKNYTEAIGHFQKSAALKQNYANAYYNLGYAYKATGDIENAIKSMTQAMQLVDPKSNDYALVSAEIESLKKSPAGTSTKSSASPAPFGQDKTSSQSGNTNPVISPPLTLPGELGPDVGR